MLSGAGEISQLVKSVPSRVHMFDVKHPPEKLGVNMCAYHSAETHWGSPARQPDLHSKLQVRERPQTARWMAPEE